MVAQWTHAGGVVVRTVNGDAEYLLVEASTARGVWVLPKGHIEAGETPEIAAAREVAEEAGVQATIVARAGENEYDFKGRSVVTVYFLMQYQGEGGRTEDRALSWRRYEDALALLHFDNLRRVLTQAHALRDVVK